MRALRWLTITLTLCLGACGPSGDGKKGDNNDPLVIEPNNDATNGDPGTNGNGSMSNIVVTDPPIDETCGDGVVDADEACDDGNAVSGDGCSSNCDIETVVFRNLDASITDGGEPCDDFGCNVSYRITLTLNNFTEIYVQEVTNIRVTVGGHQLSSGGVSCTWEQWQVAPNGRSEVINIAARYSTFSDELRVEYPCQGMFQERAMSFYPEAGDVLSEMARVEVEVTGLLEDGAVWTTTSATNVRDLR